MSNRKEKLHALMRGMIERSFPGKHGLAAAEVESWISGKEVQLEQADKGAFSRKFHGSRDWSFLDVLAMQSLAGSTRITDAFEDEVEASPADTLSTLQHASHLLKESGEAVNALMSLESGDGDISETRAELIEAREAVEMALASLNAKAPSPAPVAPMQRRAG